MSERKGGRPKGCKQSPETRAKISATRKQQCADPAVRARMSELGKAAMANPEARARMSAAVKKMWADPAMRARWVAAMTKPRPNRKVWQVPVEHLRYYHKLLRCGFSRPDARAEIKRLVEAEKAA